MLLFKNNGLGVDAHALGGVVGLVDPDEAISDLKHVVPQGDDDELGVLCLLLWTGKRGKRITSRKKRDFNFSTRDSRNVSARDRRPLC